MKLKEHHTLNCPVCQKMMRPVALGCSHCDLEVRGHFHESPLSSLDSEMAHFLNVFIHCEGKIADMEKALGISYPTVKAKIARLKEAVKPSLSQDVEAESRELTTMEILARIEKGEMDYSAGLKMIKDLQEKKK